VLRIHWPGGAKGDIEKRDFVNTAGIEGLILAAIAWEGEGEKTTRRGR
jgi:hypothetical protein